MKQQLWILNFSLVIMFAIMMFANMILKQKPPAIRRKMAIIEDIEKKKITLSKEDTNKIYKQDIFGTYVYIPQKPMQQSFVTPIPVPKPPTTTPPPPPKKPTFIDPLKITLKGIIFSSDEHESIAMIADETGKEKNYYISDKIKDGYIIKIAKSNVVILRATGQQETFFLRKTDDALQKLDKDRWKHVIKKIDDQTYQIDPYSFTKQIPSLAALIESLSLSTAYQKGNPTGIRISKANKDDVGSVIGLAQNDIITSINNLDVTNIKNRIKIYDTIVDMKEGDNITLSLKRKNQDVTLHYKLKKITQPKKLFMPAGKDGKPSTFKMSPQQQRAQKQKDFKKFHVIPPERKQIIQNIRERLLQNMKMRARNRRVR
jgi:type II secretion system protein C